MENDKTKTVVSGGVGFTGLLTIAFIVLKLCGVISWPWVWVLAPLWIDLVIAIVLIIVMILIIATVSD